MHTTVEDILRKIEQASPADFPWKAILSEILQQFECTTGTIHVLDPEMQVLLLKTYIGIPEFLLPKMSEVPIGKGMAGIAAERREPVQVCNLQTDASGVVRPGAKDTKVEGAITLPFIYQETLYGTLGIAKTEPYEFSDSEIAALQEISMAIGRKVFNRNPGGKSMA